MNTDIKLINATPRIKVELRLTVRGIACLGTAIGEIGDIAFHEDELINGVLRSCTREVYKLLEEKVFKAKQSDTHTDTKEYKIKLKPQYACTLLYVLMYVMLDWSQVDEYTKATFRHVIDAINKTL